MANHLISRNTNRQPFYYRHTSNFIFDSHRLCGGSCDKSTTKGLGVDEPNRAGVVGKTTSNHWGRACEATTPPPPPPPPAAANC